LNILACFLFSYIAHHLKRVTSFSVIKGKKNPAIVPIIPEDLDGDRRWMSMHERFVSEAKSREPDVLFIGDSHILYFEQSEAYHELFEPLHCLCFAIGGDTTATVLWRLQHEELDCISPKVIVLLIGTNNREKNSQQILEGIAAVAQLISEKQPQAQLFVLTIPPRGRYPNPKRDLIIQINSGMNNALKHIPNCKILDITEGFISSEGEIHHTVLYDYLHLTSSTYWKAFKVVHSAILEILLPYSC
ncbi:Platelet-activating factor acetylhydrolase IB subunit beta, partial [Trichinella sp. T9]